MCIAAQRNWQSFTGVFMSKYIVRLDDACERRDQAKWNRIENLLDAYEIKPLVGVIPHCQDPMMEAYEFDNAFWQRVNQWASKGWEIALHGYTHVYGTKDGGINPVNARSEFAGESLDVQMKKIESGMDVFRAHGIEPKVFFAPSHTFDDNTIAALKAKSTIRFISDTIANKPYSKDDMIFVPQQSGRVRRLPFSVVTFCYHPNTMTEKLFADLEQFIRKNKKKFISFPMIETKRKKTILDLLLEKIYFARR